MFSLQMSLHIKRYITRLDLGMPVIIVFRFDSKVTIILNFLIFWQNNIYGLLKTYLQETKSTGPDFFISVPSLPFLEYSINHY